ncbi:thyrotropin-releasing hormone receptor-like [Athalia rosae]|uniref:thyrotropin-releasing hormone receptor-like n=1 Tax=Athalia rosae TaxID=37344 RepID=UPI0020339151|nr:thyrotropin-releasing hormone receptor-like [Athalia rosae]XP_048513663.1 thyrotropin-releasing hormone receptor-like [Athalia rosae]XP_048513664.1 thyrotropin-releasing hormone receptor-like [Athalia rosae]
MQYPGKDPEVYLEVKFLGDDEVLNRSADRVYLGIHETRDATATVVHLVISFIGILTNVIVASVIAGTKSLHTAPSCYVLSIIISDLVVLAEILFVVLKRWFKFYPDIDRDYVAYLTLEASILTIVIFSLERYVALGLTRPGAYGTFKFSNGVKSVLVIWSLAATFAAMELNLNLHFVPSTRNLILVMSTAMFVVLPMVIIATLVVLVSIDTSNFRNCGAESDDSKVFATLAAVFYVSMAPYRMVSLVRFMAPTLCCSQTVLNGGYLIVELSAAVNPILYGIVAKHFRTAFKDTLRSFCAADNGRREVDGICSSTP